MLLSQLLKVQTMYRVWVFGCEDRFESYASILFTVGPISYIGLPYYGGGKGVCSSNVLGEGAFWTLSGG